MNSLSVASEASKKYIFAANNLGSTVRAIIEDLYTHSHEHVTKEDIEDILKGKRRFPKSTYIWHN